MTFNLTWEGRATDFIPELLQTVGKPGPVADHAKAAVWEAVQSAGQRDPSAWVRVSVSGWEDRDQPGLGRFTFSLDAVVEPGEIQQRLRDQRPVNLLGAQPASAPEEPGRASGGQANDA